MAAGPRLWQLEALLQQVDGFGRPKLALEQYVTPAHIAAHLLHTIETRHGALAGRRVCDLGCGPGVLAVGAAALDAALVVAVDLDEDALLVARQNLDQLEPGPVQLVQADATQLPRLWRGRFDTVLTNPPFGTKRNAGADVAFLRAALLLADEAVYSLHKRSTRAFIGRTVRQWRCEADVLAELRYDLPNTYKFHKKTSVDIEVDLWRVCPPPAGLDVDVLTTELK